MRTLEFNYENAKNFLDSDELACFGPTVRNARDLLVNRKGEGSGYLGWLDLPEDYDKKELAAIKKAAEKIRKDSDVLLVIGIGGSYLGARAAYELLAANRPGRLDGEGKTELYFAGNNLSSLYVENMKSKLAGKDFSINVISKSGTTTEPAVAFRIFKELLVEKYGADGAKGRIYCTTDRKRGALKQMADEEGYQTFVIPDDVGGRFSVLTPVGLLPIAAAGIDVDALLQGAADMRKTALDAPLEENPALLYAAVRNLLHRKGKAVEILVNYEPNMQYIAEWCKQLFAESEGKSGKGIFPASVNMTTDLHSLGQFIQDGSRIMFETVFEIEESGVEITLKKEEKDLDGLNYLEGKTLDFVNKSAMKGTMKAHVEGGVPNLIVRIPEQSAYWLGQLFYFFEFAIGVSGYISGINPFNQPGVEMYKSNMFALLGKPGYTD